VLEIVKQLVVEVVAAFEGSVEIVEKDDVEGAGFRVGRKIAVGVGREWGLRGAMCGDWGWEVLVEGGDSLLVAIFEDVESPALKAVDGFALVGHNDVDQSEICGYVEDGFAGVGSRGGACAPREGRFRDSTAIRSRMRRKAD
jgi:hypothetical protein